MTRHASHDRPLLLGRGVLDWPAIERKGGRYGLVALHPEGPPDDRQVDPVFLGGDLAAGHAGETGGLLARVVEGRRYHAPAPGAELLLGHGRLFFKRAEDDGYRDAADPNLVGVEPADGREEDWLDPSALYDLHHSVVEILFLPDGP